MKKMKVILFSFAFLLTGIAFIACNSSTTSDNTKDDKEYASAYICPMHCPGSGSTEAGICPVCKMDYVANKNHKSDGHSHDGHDHDHDGEDHKSHNHDSHDEHDH